MGLLDEAIREHLELKRRRGADVSEVERQENEAFGPGGHEQKSVAEAAEPELRVALDEPGEFAAETPPEAPTRPRGSPPPAPRRSRRRAAGGRSPPPPPPRPTPGRPPRPRRSLPRSPG